MGLQLAIGHQRVHDQEMAQFVRQLGVDGYHFNTPLIPESDGVWAAHELASLRAQCEESGTTLVAIENVPFHFLDKVMTGSDGWELQLEKFCETLRNLGEAGIPTLGYHFMPAFVWRTNMSATGRAGCSVSAFDLNAVGAGNRVDFPQTARSPSQAIGDEAMWTNYERFLTTVLPVAETSGVRLALHPDDPPVPELAGIARIFRSVDALKRAEQLSDGSRAWALNLCVGTVSEMPGGSSNVMEAIEHFGALSKIAGVHLRDVQGTVPSFQECFLGEGNCDITEVVRRLHHYELEGFIIDDHVPAVIGDTVAAHRAHAHAIGYIQGVIAGANR